MRNLKKVVTSKQLRLAVETEEEKRAKLENDAATKWLRLAMETDEERKARLETYHTAQVALETEEERRAKKNIVSKFELILIEIGVFKNKKFQGMSSLAL